MIIIDKLKISFFDNLFKILEFKYIFIILTRRADSTTTRIETSGSYKKYSRGFSGSQICRKKD